MSDFTLCSSKECPMKDTCFRAQAEPDSLYQSYLDFEYTCHEYNGFAYYIRLSKGDYYERQNNEENSFSRN